MQVTGFGPSAAAWLSSLGKTGAPEKLDVSLPEYDGKIERVEIALPRMSFPTAPPASLGADALLALQGGDAQAKADGGEGIKPSAEDQFLDYMKKTPEERIRDKILKALGITEEDLEAMPPEERLAIEEKIRDIIKETIVPEEVTKGASADDPQAQPTFDQLVQNA